MNNPLSRQASPPRTQSSAAVLLVILGGLVLLGTIGVGAVYLVGRTVANKVKAEGTFLTIAAEDSAPGAAAAAQQKMTAEKLGMLQRQLEETSKKEAEMKAQLAEAKDQAERAKLELELERAMRERSRARAINQPKPKPESKPESKPSSSSSQVLQMVK